MRDFFAVLFFAAVIVSAPSLAGVNEPAMPAGKDPGGVAVAIIDSGVNYTLKQITPRLARDPQGNLIGYDFHDNDHCPFDVVPGQKPDAGRHHGTRVAAIFLREAPKARLAPYRYRAHSFETFVDIVNAIAKNSVGLLVFIAFSLREELNAI